MIRVEESFDDKIRTTKQECYRLRSCGASLSLVCEDIWFLIIFFKGVEMIAIELGLCKLAITLNQSELLINV